MCYNSYKYTYNNVYNSIYFDGKYYIWVCLHTVNITTRNNRTFHRSLLYDAMKMCVSYILVCDNIISRVNTPPILLTVCYTNR